MEQDGVLPYGGNNPGQSDPMQIVRAAMSYGRKQAGLPEMFFQEPSTPSFDDGGMVPDPSQQMPPEQDQGGASLPDPRKAMAYLTGDGALAPDIVGALEQIADPDGSMDPAQRVLATFAQMKSPDSAAGLLAHYRTKFNARSGAARAALSQGNAAEAAAQATQAFANVPTGKSVRFAPAPNGIVVHARKPGQQQALSMGGTVDTSNPENSAGDVDDTTGGTEEDPSFDGGGAVEDPYEGMPESNNIEDRRGENGEGYVPKQDGPDPERAGVLQKESHAEYRRDEDKRNKQRGEGVVPKQSSFDDGGEVEAEEEATDGVLPTQGQTAEPVQTPQGETDEPPVVLSPADFNKMMTAGYDKPVEQGWGKFLSSLFSMEAGAATAPQPTPGWAMGVGTGNGDVAPSAPAAPPAAPPTPALNFDERFGPSRQTGGAMRRPAKEAPDWGTSRAGGTWTLPAPRQPASPKAPPEPERDQDDMRAPTTNKRLAEEGGPGGYNQYRMQTPGERNAPRPAEDPSFARHQQMANKLFPWLSQERQRSDYIQRMMGLESGQRDKMELAREHTRGLEIGAQQRATTNTENNTQKMLRLDRSLMSKAEIEASHEWFKRLEGADQRKFKTFATEMMNDPKFVKMSPAEQAGRVDALGRMMGLDPQTTRDAFASRAWEQPAAGAPAPGARPAGPQQQQPPGSPQPSAQSGAQGEKTVIRLKDGTRLMGHYDKATGRFTVEPGQNIPEYLRNGR